MQIAIFNADGHLPAPLEAEVRAGIDEGIAALSAHIPLPNIGISVHTYGFVSRFTGFGGMSYGSDSCVLYIDETLPAAAINTRAKAAATTVHELHHCLRQKTFPRRRFEDWPAGDTLILEGLATQCELFLGYPEPDTLRGTDRALTEALLAKIAPIIGDAKADWGWLHAPSGFPENTYKALYPMGHALVGRYLAETGETPISAINTPWQEIWNTVES